MNEPSYRWEPCDREKCKAERHLVEDSRLQDIADAPKCEHGNIDRHIIGGSIRRMELIGTIEMDWCDGAPKLRALLDGLVNNE